MEIKLLRTFLALSKIRNYTQTAKELNYAQSNISAQIQQLEKELQVKLFEQIGKKVYLTAEGERLVPYASRMLSMSDDITSLFHRNEDSRIILGAAESLSIYKLAPILQEFTHTHSDVKLFLKVLDLPDFIPMLTNNSIDIAFTLDNKCTLPSINIPYQHRESLSFFLSPCHPLAGRASISWTDLQAFSLVLTSPDCCYRKILEQSFSIHQLSPTIMLETSSVPIIKQCAVNGLGICFLPEYTAIEEIEKGQLVKLPLSVESSVYSQLCIHKDKWISPALQDLIDLMSTC